MKKTFITPELKRIEINLSNDIADVSYRNKEGKIFLSFYTWAVDGTDTRVATCSTYVKGGSILELAQPIVESSSVSYHVGIGDYHEWTATLGDTKSILDNCMTEAWGNAVPQTLQFFSGPSSSIY